MITSKRIRILAAFTLLFMGGLGLILLQLRTIDLSHFWSPISSLVSPSRWGTFFRALLIDDGYVLEYLHGKSSWVSQIGMGLGLGLIISILAHFILSRRFIENISTHYRNVFNIEKIGYGDIIFLSLSAGIGEELLFRGGIQYYLGIWITAFLFVAIHGYLNPKSWQISVYGFFMSIAMAVLGYATESYGIVSAMIAHAFIDIYLLMWMKYEDRAERTMKNRVRTEAREISRRIRGDRIG